MKKALITGVTGQDGSYLVEFLLAKGYEAPGTIRRLSTFCIARIDHICVDPPEPGARLMPKVSAIIPAYNRASLL